MKRLFCESCAKAAKASHVVVNQGTWLLESCYGCGVKKQSQAYELVRKPK